MRKIIKILSQLSLISIGSLATAACNGRLLGGGELHPGKPVEPEVKDRDYYLNLIAENEANIEDCKEWLNDIEKERNEANGGENSEEEYELAKKEINAEIYFYQAEINEAQYQILLIKNNGEITTADKAEAIIYLTEKLENLKQELELKTKIIEKYPEEYSDTEIAEICVNIRESNENLTKILEIEDKKDDYYNSN